MSDTKLREKADALIAFTLQGPRFIAWVQAVTDALAPAPEKVAKVSAFPVGNCVVCGELVAPYNKHAKYEGGYTCQRPQPAPPEPAKVECPNCGEMTERSHSRYEGPGPDKWACQPAPPEPAAPEMPEAVKNAWKALRKENYETFALALESWWRTHSAPRVGMTEELRMILDVAESRAEDQRHDGLLECSRNLERAIAAVRQQAAQGRKVELGKARKMLEYMRRCAWHEETYQQIEEALAELDAAEKGEGRG